MTVINLLYGTDSISQNPEQGVQPIQVKGAHLSKLHEAMISFYVGQIMERPLEEREAMILNAPIMPDLKVQFLEMLERVSVRCKEIERELGSVQSVERIVELFQEIRCLHLHNTFNHIIGSLPNKHRNAAKYQKYLEIMRANFKDKILFEMLRDWLPCYISEITELDLLLQERADVPKIRLYIKIKEEVAIRFAEGLKLNTSMRSLRFDHERISTLEAVQICEGLKMNTSLQKLALPVNEIGDEGAEALAGVLLVHPSLKSLRFWNNKITDAGAKAIAEALEKNSVCKKLSLKYNPIGDAGAQALGKMLKVNTTLRILDIASTRLGDIGLVGLAEGLIENKTLKRLDLSQNCFQAEGGVMLAEALKQNRSLTSLNLWNNCIGDKGAEAFAAMVKVNSTLTCLILNYNKFGVEGKELLHEVKDLYPDRRIDF